LSSGDGTKPPVAGALAVPTRFETVRCNVRTRRCDDELAMKSYSVKSITNILPSEAGTEMLGWLKSRGIRSSPERQTAAPRRRKVGNG
jgi:hypothetical protein